MLVDFIRVYVDYVRAYTMLFLLCPVNRADAPIY
jgi:hypothetical protein